MEAHLNRPYISVPLSDKYSYGGNQMWFPRRMLSHCGCGPIAAFDLLNYVAEDYGNAALPFLSRDDYMLRFEVFQKKYFPFLYPNGINGFILSVGLNRAFHHAGIPLSSYWTASEGRILPRTARMLENNIPVVLSVGPHFPDLWNKSGVSLYRRGKDGSIYKCGEALSHYVTVTDLRDQWMTVSSWGSCYEISIPEYLNYIKKSSTSLFSSILLVKRRGG